MCMMHWADCQKSKRTDRYRQRMDMMPLETVHGKKKMAKGLRTSTISSTRWWAKSIEKSGKSTATAAIGAGVGAGINLISQGINIARGKQKKFNVGSFFGSAIEGGIVAGVSAIPGVGTVAVGLSAGVGGGINSVLKQYGESGEIDIGQVAEDAMVSGVVGGIAYKFTSIRNAKAGKTPTAQEISANAKTRDARKKVLDEIKASGKTPSGLRRRVDSSYALKHKELLKKYAQSSIVGNSKELLANQLEYETDIYVIKGHANIKGYIKDMLKDFLPIENSDDWIMSILSNNIKVDKDGEETLEICGVMG